jgi:hypothetical protein
MRKNFYDIFARKGMRGAIDRYDAIVYALPALIYKIGMNALPAESREKSVRFTKESRGNGNGIFTRNADRSNGAPARGSREGTDGIVK